MSDGDQRAPVPGPREETVVVHITDVSNPNDIGAWMEGSIVEPDGQTLVFQNDRHPGFVVNFDVVDETRSNYLFPDDTELAMWVKPVAHPGESCPDEQYWRQFQASAVSQSNARLTVRNFNARKQVFKFCLRFTQTPERPDECVVYDPIGNNGNGSSS